MFRIIKKSNKLPLVKTINLPLSKSISNRELILNYLISGKIHTHEISTADDTILLIKCLNQIKLAENSAELTEINVDNAGTVMRFLTSVLAISKGSFILKGNERMHQRPISELVDALNNLGADIIYLDKTGFPPLKITGKDLKNNEIEIRSDISSQFISSLLLVSGFLKNGLIIHLLGKPSSEPYILMTLNLLKKCRFEYIFDNNCIHVFQNKNPELIKSSEADWSSAAFWYEIVSFSDNLKVKLLNLKKDDIQGDKVISDIFKSFGVETIFEEDGILLFKNNLLSKEFVYDFSNCPDLAQVVAVTAAALGIKTRLNGLESLKIKETDRLSAICTELKKLNVDIYIDNNSLIINKSEIEINETINTYNDHRMIMSFAPLAILYESIEIDNIKDVSKSYPDFWVDTNDIFAIK